MSRIGKAPVKVPSGVTISVDGGVATVQGPKGTLSQPVISNVKISQENDEIKVDRIDDEKISRSNHGLMRTLLQNMVTGVSQGFEKKLEVNGVGFRVSLAGNQLKLNLGYSHSIDYTIPEGISIKTEQNTITVSGASKQQVGQVAAEIRALRKPEPYKGKGIKYADERIIRKSGKSGKE